MKHLDKNTLKHFAVNYTSAAIFGEFGVGLGLGASVTKEYCDNNYAFPWDKTKGHWCWVDLAADALGLILGYATNYFIFKQLW